MIKLTDGMHDRAGRGPVLPGSRAATSSSRGIQGTRSFPSNNHLVDETQKSTPAAFGRLCAQAAGRRTASVLPVLMIAGAFLLLKIGCPTPIAIVVLTLFVFGPYLGMVHA